MKKLSILVFCLCVVFGYWITPKPKLQFGNTNVHSFPAYKKDGNILQPRLADDSNDFLIDPSIKINKSIQSRSSVKCVLGGTTNSFPICKKIK